MNSLFLHEIEYLMQWQQRRAVGLAQSNSGNKYNWLSSNRGKLRLRHLTAKEEAVLDGALRRVSQSDKMNALRELRRAIEKNSDANYDSVPQLAVRLLQKIEAENLVKTVALSRLSSFRCSLRKLSILSNNKISPNGTNLRRSVAFNDQPTIFCISK